MGVYAKVRVNFAEGCLLDFDQLVHDLKSTYNIGFAGLYKVEEGVSVFIQRHNNATRMTLPKVRNICANVADVTEVTPFETCEGKLLDSFGNFRSRGRKANVTVNSHNTTTNSHNTNSYNTNSHNTTNIHLLINALGKEDISHITKEHLDDIIGTRDEVLEYLETNMPFHAQSELMKKHWEMFRRYAQKKVRRWDKQQEHQDPGHESLSKSLNIQSDSEEDDEEEEEPMLERPPIYDPDSDSEGNLKRKRVCFEEGMVETYPGHTFQDFLVAFERLLLENPHNSNIVASTKDKYFKYFNGDDWVKLNKNQFFEEVTTRRVEKADDTLNKMVRDGSMSEFTRDQVSSIIKKLFDFTSGTEKELFLRDTREDVANGIFAAEKNGARLARIGKLLGRRIVRVGDSAKENVVRSSTWENLERMST